MMAICPYSNSTFSITSFLSLYTIIIIIIIMIYTCYARSAQYAHTDMNTFYLYTECLKVKLFLLFVRSSI